MTTQPTVARPAETRRAADPNRYRLPATWCYRCGEDHGGWSRHVDPQPLESRAAVADAALIATDQLACPGRLDAWAPGHIASVRELAAQLTRWADIAEQ